MGIKLRTCLLLILSLSVLFIACGGGGTAPKRLPVVTGTSPKDGDIIAVGDISEITATFAKPMEPLTINESTFTVTTRVGSVKGKVTYDSAYNKAIFKPLINLAPATMYLVTITTDVKNVDGNSMEQDYSWIFLTGGQPYPVVSITYPDSNAEYVPINAAVTATFSKPMDPASITATSFVINEQGGGKVVGTITYDEMSQTATFMPSGNFADNTAYIATITTQVKDTNIPDSYRMAEDYIWSFVTGPDY